MDIRRTAQLRPTRRRAVNVGRRRVLASLAGAGCRGQHAAGYGQQTVPVLVAKAEQKTVATRLHAIGRVEAFSTVNIKAQLDGVITEVHFKEGQDVKRGDLLFVIDPRPFEAALLQAQANLARDQAKAAQSKADESRYSYLLKQRVGSQRQYDQAHATAAADKAAVSADEAEVQTAKLNLASTPRFARQSTAAPATCWCIRGIWSRTTRTPRWS